METLLIIVGVFLFIATTLSMLMLIHAWMNQGEHEVDLED